MSVGGSHLYKWFHFGEAAIESCSWRLLLLESMWNLPTNFSLGVVFYQSYYWEARIFVQFHFFTGVFQELLWAFRNVEFFYIRGNLGNVKEMFIFPLVHWLKKYDNSSLQWAWLCVKEPRAIDSESLRIYVTL